jgi:hypothetical protein
MAEVATDNRLNGSSQPGLSYLPKVSLIGGTRPRLVSMLLVTHVVWRHLLEEARAGRRSQPSLSQVAADLGLGISTVHKALVQPVEIEAVRVSRLGGLEILDPYRLLLMFAGARRLQRDVVAHARVPFDAPAIETLAAADSRMIIGGFGAVVSHVGANPIAMYTTVLLYGDPEFLEDLPIADGDVDGTDVLIAEPDRWLSSYGNVTTFAQAFADLFRLPGWQAARFIEEIDPWTIATGQARELVIA